VAARTSLDVQARQTLRDDVIGLLETVSGEHTRQSALVVAMHATAAAFASRGLLFSFVPHKLLRSLAGGMVPAAPADAD